MTIILTRQDVQQVLNIRDCIETIAKVMQRFSAGDTVMPVRLVTRVPERGVHAAMPAVLPSLGVFGVKSITVFPTNPSRGAPSIMGLVILNETETGRPLAVMDAAYLTGIRTAAASAVATRLLANPGASSLALIGAGVQAGTHLWGMTEVRPVQSVAVFDIDPQVAESFILAQAQRFPELAFRQAVSPEDAIRSADLVCTISSSRTPVIDYSWLKPGVHINGVGSHTPDARELDGRTVQAARVAVDSPRCCTQRSGRFHHSHSGRAVRRRARRRRDRRAACRSQAGASFRRPDHALQIGGHRCTGCGHSPPGLRARRRPGRGR